MSLVQDWTAADISCAIFGRDDLALLVSMYACLWKDPLSQKRSEKAREDLVRAVKNNYAAQAALLAQKFGHNGCPAVVERNIQQPRP